MLIGGAVAVMGSLGTIINIFLAYKNRSSLMQIMIRNTLFFLLYALGGVTFTIGLIMFFIHLAKS
jgi:hypothetical protein